MGFKDRIGQINRPHGRLQAASPPPLVPVDPAPAAPLAVQPEPAGDRRLLRTFMDIKERLDSQFVNRTPILGCGAKAFTITDVVAAAIQSRTNIYLIGSRGSGKTMLSETIRRSVFGDRGLYLRGDPNLNLKDLFMKINLHGKTDEEIYRVSETLGYNFVLIDELNRVPGILQNQFLNLLDGYVEIRGVRYNLGTNDYMLAVSTGNPPANGEYTGVFDEDLALLDRIPLIVNVDEVEHAGGDIARIMSLDSAPAAMCDMTQSVIGSNRYLLSKAREDPQMAVAIALMSEFIYRSFRYVVVEGKMVDKAQDDGWRDSLLGEHSGGKTISYVSDVSVRTLKRAARLGFALFQIGSAESEELSRAGIEASPFRLKEFMEAYTGALKLALNYDRRFIPADLPRRLDKTHAELLELAFKDLSDQADENKFQDACLYLMEFTEALGKGDRNTVQLIMNDVANSKGESPVVHALHGVLDSLLREAEDRRRALLLGRRGPE